MIGRVVLAALALLAAPESSAQDVYILAGQSNMSGRGSLDDLTAPERLPDPGIRSYGNDDAWHAAVDPLDDASRQVDSVSGDRQAAVGPGLFFARAIRATAKAPIAVIPCAKGGSPIASWKPATTRDTLYGSCLARVRAAGGRLAGILWYQGESDARTMDAARGWADAFGSLVAAFRRDLAAPRLPVVFVQISDAPARPGDADRYPGWATVQAAQADVALPCAAMVSARGLERLDDDLHLTTAAQRSLGRRLAAAMLRLQRRTCR